MWNRSPSLKSTLCTASAVSSMLLCGAGLTAGASAQSLPATGVSSGGVDLTTGPEGVKLEVDGGDTGGVTVGAGRDGVDLGLRTTPKRSAPPAESDPGERVSVPGGPTEDPRSGTSPGQAAPGAGRGGAIAVTGDGPARDSERGRAPADGRSGDRSGGTSRLDDLRTTARADRDGQSGVAPVFDLVERIPAAVRAALLALALIALALWALWVRGRRRLQHNAYLDPDTDVANMAAFEQVLERECLRATRYRRPLGLLLLEVEHRGSGGIRLLGEGDARDAVDDINWEVRESDTVARLSPSRFAVICPEAPQGSVETLAHAIEHRLEERRLRCWAGFAERDAADEHPADLVARAAGALAQAQAEPTMEVEAQYGEPATRSFPGSGDRAAAA